MRVDPTAPAGAICSLHADRAASQVCSRCGNFMCAECSAGGVLCPACRGLAADRDFSFSRENHEIGGLFSYAYEALKRDPVLLGVGALIVMVAGSVGSVISQVAMQIGAVMTSGEQMAAGISLMVVGVTGGTLLSVLAQGVLQMGLTRMCLDVLFGGKADLSRLFSQFKRLGAFVVQMLIIFGVALAIIAVIVGAGAAIGFAAGLVSTDASYEKLLPVIFIGVAVATGLLSAFSVFASPVYLAPLELVYGGGSGFDSLKRAFTIGENHRFEIFGYLMVGGAVMFAAVIVGLLMCGIGVMVTIPLALAMHQLLLTAKFLALRRGSGVPEPEAS